MTVCDMVEGLSKRGKFARHSPWIAIIIMGAVLNWYMWIDEALRPAITVYHEQTVLTDINNKQRNVFRPGETIVVHGEVRVNRVCDRRYVRTLTDPRGETIPIKGDGGVRYVKGKVRRVVYIRTMIDWPEGGYTYTTYGLFDCNPPFRQQVIKGYSANFILSRGAKQ